MIHNISALPKLKGEELQKRYASIEVRNMMHDDGVTPRIERYDNCYLNPLGQISDIKPKADEVMLVDDCDFCTEAYPGGARGDLLNGTTVYCGYLRFQWGHFLLNSTSRLWYALINPNVDRFLFFASPYESGTISGNYLEFFELLGIADKVELVRGPVSVARIIVPEIGLSPESYFSPQAMAVFETVSVAAMGRYEPDEFPEKVLLTRSALPSASKSEFGIEMIDKLFAENGYTVIAPESMSLSRMICHLCKASSIVSISGSTAHNLIFCPPERDMFIIERDSYNNLFQPVIGIALNACVTHIQASLAPATVAIGRGPFFYYFTPWLEKFARTYGLSTSCIKDYKSPRYIRRTLKRYFISRRSFYGDGVSVENMLVPQASLFFDLASFTLDCLGEYMRPSLMMKICRYLPVIG